MRQGFSLVELSIVLVIIALIAGGVMLGKDLIRAAEIRGQITQLQEIKSAFDIFRDRYDALPGDMPDATDYWGIAGGATGIDATCYDTDSTTLADPKATCNGNGDGWIRQNSYCAAGDNCYLAERFRVWQHLSNAGVLEGQFTGRTGPAGNWDPVSGINTPAAKVRRAEVMVHGENTVVSGNANWFDGFGLNTYLQVEGFSLTSNAAVPIFTPEDAWSIDAKLDDGRPASGNVVGYKQSSTREPNCTTADDETAEYNLVSSDILCNIRLIIMRQN